MMTRIINVDTCKMKDWQPEEYVYCGRRFDTNKHFGNPFHLRTDDRINREICIYHFRQWLDGTCFWATGQEARRLWILQHIEDLRDKVLGCHCKPKLCHCDSYLEILTKSTPWGKIMSNLIETYCK